MTLIYNYILASGIRGELTETVTALKLYFCQYICNFTIFLNELKI